VRTFFDEDEGDKPSKEQRLASIDEFVPVYAPFAQDLAEDFRTVASFIGAINTGIESLEEIKVDKNVWSRAHAYMEARPL
jgi:Temperature dependent protein affecting M2 dsRNA replication